VDKVRERLMLEDFKQIPGVDEAVEKALKDAGYQTVQNLLAASEEALAALPGVESSLASQIKHHVASLADPRFEQDKPDEGQEQLPSDQAPTE
jgi:large subunit ribosomal protein L32e